MPQARGPRVADRGPWAVLPGKQQPEGWSTGRAPRITLLVHGPRLKRLAKRSTAHGPVVNS
jgi:hypothetical protein